MKRIIALLMALCMVLSLFAACGSTETGSAAASESVSAHAEEAAPVEAVSYTHLTLPTMAVV